MASATTKQLAQVPIVSREKRPDPSNNAAALAPTLTTHTGPSRPKPTQVKRHGKCLASGVDVMGLAAWLTVGNPQKCAHMVHVE